MTLEFVGEATELPESVIQEGVAFLAKDVLDTLHALCGQPRRSSASGK